MPMNVGPSMTVWAQQHADGLIGRHTIKASDGPMVGIRIMCEICMGEAMAAEMS